MRMDLQCSILENIIQSIKHNFRWNRDDHTINVQRSQHNSVNGMALSLHMYWTIRYTIDNVITRSLIDESFPQNMHHLSFPSLENYKVRLSGLMDYWVFYQENVYKNSNLALVGFSFGYFSPGGMRRMTLLTFMCVDTDLGQSCNLPLSGATTQGNFPNSGSCC